MSILLNIDTASEKAQVSFVNDAVVLHSIFSESQKEHASFLQSAILELTKITGIKLPDMDAVAIIAGPGSYTGLRVGMSSAKGLCYALKKPLIAMSTLEVLTVSAIQLFPELGEQFLYCPMIDARRMEVFTAVYQKELTEYVHPSALVLNEFSFAKELAESKMLFFGTGSEKWGSICKHSNAVFKTVPLLAEAMSQFSTTLFLKGHFSNLAYCEPFYLKEFQTVNKK